MNNLLVGNYFYPIGGSAFVIKALVEYFPDWNIEIFTGSTEGTKNFFQGWPIHRMNYTPAINSFKPMEHNPPMHGANRDKEDSPDIIWSKLNDNIYKKQVAAWRELFYKATQDPDLLYLSHLNPMHQAAHELWEDKPIVTHLHGPELLFLEQEEINTDPYFKAWSSRMKLWLRNSSLILTAPGNETRVKAFCPDGNILAIGNGIHPDKTKKLSEDRESVWQEVFIKERRGLDSNGNPLEYSYKEIRPLSSVPVFIACGRFTKVKQFPLLIESWAKAKKFLPDNASLVIVGGFPGENEGETPLDSIKRTGAKNVFLAGWWPSEDLPRMFSASDVFLMSSAREQFGIVLLEAAACELPAVSISSPGPNTLIKHGETGLLVDNSAEALTKGIENIYEQKGEWGAMGKAAREYAVSNFSQKSINEHLSSLFKKLINK